MRANQAAEQALLFCRQATPFLMSLILLFMGLFPFRFSFLADLYIPLIYISLFCWMILRPDLLPPLSVFVLGLLADLMYATPIGLNSLIFMLFYLLMMTQRRFLIGHSFSFLWSIFAVLMVPVFLLQWGLVCAIQMQGMSFAIVLGQYLLAVGFYPLIAWACAKVYDSYLGDLL